MVELRLLRKPKLFGWKLRARADLENLMKAVIFVGIHSLVAIKLQLNAAHASALMALLQLVSSAQAA
jgi:hypothetical protein